MSPVETSDAVYTLAQIIQGEAGVCPLMAMVAVAYVYQRNPRFYGRAEPGMMALFVARHWQRFPDPTNGAIFLFSREDLRNPRVQALARGKPSAMFRCRAGLRLYAYGGRRAPPRRRRGGVVE